MSMMLMMLAAGGGTIDPFDAEFILIAGGGSASSATNGAGGGGAGGFITTVSGETGPGGASSGTPPNLNGATNFSVTIGAAGSNSVFSGTDSSGTAFSYTALAGGDGGNNNGQGGGSGGGGAYPNGSYGSRDSGTPFQGHDGAYGQSTVPNYCSNSWAQGYPQCEEAGGGGGGAGLGASNTQGSIGNGGNGIQSSITGTATYYAGGGAGTNKNGASGTAGSGYQNYGGGGSGGNSASGQSGVLILRYTTDATISNPGGGLTMSTTVVGSNNVTTITAGTGNIRFD